jgi:hypothetical protein
MEIHDDGLLGRINAWPVGPDIQIQTTAPYDNHVRDGRYALPLFPTANDQIDASNLLRGKRPAIVEGIDRGRVRIQLFEQREQNAAALDFGYCRSTSGHQLGTVAPTHTD